MIKDIYTLKANSLMSHLTKLMIMTSLFMVNWKSNLPFESRNKSDIFVLKIMCTLYFSCIQLVSHSIWRDIDTRKYGGGYQGKICA